LPATHSAPVLGRAWLAAIALLVVTLVAYGPSLWRAQFLNFDDNFYFGPDNAVFRAASAAAEEHGVLAGLGVVLDPSAIVADVWLPVAHASLWIDAWWGGGTPFLPHLHAALLHALAAILLLLTLRELRLPQSVAIPAAFAFALHPALCESVAWVSGRKDVLCGVFAFAALWRTVRCVERTTVRELSLVVLLSALAMLSKATAVVIPAVAVLLLLLRRAPRRAYLATLASIAAVLPLALLHQHNAALAGTMAQGNVVDRLPQVAGALLHYVSVAAWPAGLNVLYPEVATLERFVAARWWTWPALAAIALCLLASMRSARLRGPACLLLAFFAALVPFNTAYPASVISVADRYLYLALPWLWAAAFALIPDKGRTRIAAALVACVALLAATWLRAPAFTSSERLWTASLAAAEDNAVALLNLLQARSAATAAAKLPSEDDKQLAERAAKVARYPEHERRAQLQLAQFALQENRFEAAVIAMAAAVEATERVRDSGRVPRAIGEALLVETLLSSLTPLRLAGREVDADRALDRARSLRPDDARVAAAEVLLAVEALAKELRIAPLTSEAPEIQRIEERLASARRAAPHDAQLDYAAAMLARLQGKSLLAIANFRRAASQRPDLAEAWVGAAEVCLDAGLAKEAEDYARQAIGLSVQSGRVADPRLRLALARALQGQGRLDEAIGSLRDYCDQTGLRDREAARLLSGLWMHKARQRISEPDVTHTELQTLIDRALHYNPSEPAVDLVRARILRDQRQFAAAIECLERLSRSLPDLEDTGPMLAENLRDLGYERLFAKDDNGAANAWLQCVARAPKDFATDAIRMQLQAVWRRQESLGIDARKAGDEQKARAAFRLCLQIDPDNHWPAWLLAAGMVEDEATDLAELDEFSRRALEGQRLSGLEHSRQVAVRALALRRLGRTGEAKSLVDGYLQSPDAEAPADVLRALSRIQQELAR
jgi:tetratricopeptide (TPR) repeat protein